MGGIQGHLVGIQGHLDDIQGHLDDILGPPTGGLDCQEGSSLEHQASMEAKIAFGDGYAQPLLAQSLQDLALLLPDGVCMRTPVAKRSVSFAVHAICLAIDCVSVTSVPNTHHVVPGNPILSGGGLLG